MIHLLIFEYFTVAGQKSFRTFYSPLGKPRLCRWTSLAYSRLCYSTISHSLDAHDILRK